MLLKLQDYYYDVENMVRFNSRGWNKLSFKNKTFYVIIKGKAVPVPSMLQEKLLNEYRRYLRRAILR